MTTPSRSTIVSRLMRMMSTCRLWLCAAAVLAWAVDQAAAQAPVFLSAGDANNLWVIRSNTQGTGFSILHRRPGDQPESRLTEAASELTGRIAPNGIAAGDGYLLLVYEDRTVQTIRVSDDGGPRRVPKLDFLPSMPRGVALRSLSITRSVPWALVRIEDPAVLQAIDHPPEDVGSKRKDDGPVLYVKPSVKEKPKEPPPTKTETRDGDDKAEKKDNPEKTDGTNTAEKEENKVVAPPAPPETGKPRVKADRLLCIKQGRWVSVPMPADWPADAEGWLVDLGSGASRPALVVAVDSPRALRVYRAADSAEAEDAWTSRQHEIAEVISLPPLVVDKQLVLARRTKTPGQIELALSVARPEGVSEIGLLSVHDGGNPAAAWALAAVGERVALIVLGKDGAMSLRRMNVQGRGDPAAIPLVSQPPPLGPMTDQVVFVAVLMLATPMLILMLRRDPSSPVAQLPATARLADLPMRALAGAIDLAPCVAGAMWYWQISLLDLATAWPGNSGGWERMIPGLAVIGAFIGYCFLCELFTATTLGKAAVGLRVTGLRGEPPDLWQVLVRNVLKALDLIAPPLFVFAVISPSRQRLGDVVARTVVTTRVKPGDDDGEGGEKRKRSEEERSLDPRPRGPRNKS